MHFGIGIGAAVAFLAAIELFLRYEAAERQSMPSPGHNIKPHHLPAKTPPDEIRRGLFAKQHQSSPLKRRSFAVYFSEVLMFEKVVLSVEPRPFTAAMIASAIPAAIRPYSIAVAPD
jgi:hypothetical protein